MAPTGQPESSTVKLGMVTSAFPTGVPSRKSSKSFLPLHFEAITANTLEAVCYQGKQSVSEYLDEFLNLVEDSRNTDPKIIVVKFHRGLNRRISAAPGRPSDADPDAWFSFAIQMEQDFAAEANPSTPVRSGVVCQTPAFIDEATCVSATPEATFHSSTPAEEASGDPASADKDIRASTLSEKVGCSPGADDPSAPAPISEAPPVLTEAVSSMTTTPASTEETNRRSVPPEAPSRTPAPEAGVPCTSAPCNAAYHSPASAEVAEHFSNVTI